MTPGLRNQTLALAGLFQATQLVKQLAWEGTLDQDAATQSLRSVFVIEADSVADIYPHGVGHGLRVLRGQLGGDPQSRDMEVTRYTATLLQLQRKLAAQPQMLETISVRLGQTRELLHAHAVTDPLITARLAGIYQDTVSTLTPRVMVNGEHAHLANEEVASRVRALLLAGIRAAVLWRQSGGSRWQLLFRRNQILRTTEQMIHEQLQ